MTNITVRNNGKADIVQRIRRIIGPVIGALILGIAISAPVSPASAQRRGGGFSSFGRSGGGGGGFGRNGGSFGQSNRGGSFNSGSSNRSAGSFNRSGGFGSRTYTSSSSLGSRYYTGGRFYSAHFYGGYGDYWYHPMWYYWMPWHPAFYYSSPYMGADGYYYPGGFSFFRLLLSLLIFGFIIWLLFRIFSGGRSVRYTTYS